MIDNILLCLVESILGKGVPASKGNYAFVCPICKHSGRKLEVNMITNTKSQNPYHCWTCTNFKGLTLKSLFYSLKVNSNKYEELNSILGTTYKTDYIHQEIKIELPQEFQPFISLSKTNIISKHALKYLIKDRGISFEDIIKHNIGFCETGKYKNKIIIPTYNKEGVLEYFIARSFEKDPYRKFDAPVSDKNIVGFESLINFDLPITICEGAFDSIAIKRNAIPLFGKSISKKLQKTLMLNKVKSIFLALDEDALKSTLKIAEELIHLGKKVYVVRLGGKDPSEIGFEAYNKIVEHLQPFTFGDLVKLKLELC